MMRKLLFAVLMLWNVNCMAQLKYQMAGPYEVVARDGQYAYTKGGSERDMWTAYQFVREKNDSEEYATALKIISAYAKALQRFDGHDAPLCTIQAYWLVRAMTVAKEHKTPEWTAMIRRAILPVLEQFESDSPYANGNWGAIVNRCRMACAIFLEDSMLYKASIDYYMNANDNGALSRYINETGQCQETGRDQAHVQLGIGALCDICEMAWIQGDDLWSAYDNRLMKGLEYTARYNLGYDIPFETWQEKEKVAFEAVVASPVRTWRRGRLSTSNFEVMAYDRVLKITIFNRPWAKTLKDGGYYVMSGILEGQENLIVETAEKAGL